MGRQAFVAVLVLSLIIGTFAREDDTDIQFSLYNQLRQIHNDFYRWVDTASWASAPVQTSADPSVLWANPSTGAVNLAVLQSLKNDYKAHMDAISTSNVRQCDRISGKCFVCGNGTDTIATAIIDYMVQNKLFGQHHVMGDIAVKYKSSIDNKRIVLYNTYYLGSASGVNDFTCLPVSLTATSNCLPKTFSECRLNHYYADREHEFLRVDGVYLLDKIRTGYRYTYTSAGELGGRLLRPSPDALTLAGLVAKFGPTVGPAIAAKLADPVVGDPLPPQEIMDDYSIQGLYCQ